MGIRAADTITIVGSIFGSYKLASIAESLGTLTQIASPASPACWKPAGGLAGHLDGHRSRPGRTRPGRARRSSPTSCRSSPSRTSSRTSTSRSTGSAPAARRSTTPSAAPATAASWSSLARRATRRVRHLVRLGHRGRLHRRGTPGLRGRGRQCHEHRRAQAGRGESLRALRPAAPARLDRLEVRGGRLRRGRARRDPLGRSCGPCTTGTRPSTSPCACPPTRGETASWRCSAAALSAGGPVLHRRRGVRRRHRADVRPAPQSVREPAPGDALVARLRLGQAARLRAQTSVRQDAVVARIAIGFLLSGNRPEALTHRGQNPGDDPRRRDSASRSSCCRSSGASRSSCSRPSSRSPRRLLALVLAAPPGADGAGTLVEAFHRS